MAPLGADVTFEFDADGRWSAWHNSPRQPAVRGSFRTYAELKEYIWDRLDGGTVKVDDQ